MKKLLVGLLFVLLSACGPNESQKSQKTQEKSFFEGKVTGSIPITSQSGEDKIKSVSVKLNSGEVINVFVEQTYPLPKGKQVKVFKYDNNVVYYLEKE